MEVGANGVAEDEPFDRDLQKHNFGGHESLLREVLGLFREKARESIAEITEACRNRDLDSLVRSAHALKGNSALVGARAVSHAAAGIEAAARDGVVDDLDELIDKLTDAVRAAVESAALPRA